MGVYFRHRVAIDWSAALLAGLALMMLEKNGFLPASRLVDGRLFLATATIGATLLGFSLASASFLISHTSSQGMEFLRRSKSFTQLSSLLASALWRFFALAVVSLVVFLTYTASPTLSLGVYMVFSSAAILSATALIWSAAAIVRLTR